MESSKFFDSDVLVVDDQESLLKQATSHLEPVFGAIATFFDPAKAAAHLRSGEHYKCILLDVNMEPVTGLALLKLARQLDSAAQVIMISGQGNMDSAIKALQLGAVDYILKPVNDWGQVIRVVRRAVEEWNLRHDNLQLMRELQQRNDELARSVELLRQLNQTTEMMHGARDVREILNVMLRSTSNYLEAGRVSIMVRDPKNEEMAIHVAEGLDLAQLKHVRVRPNDGIVGLVMASKRPIVVNDASHDDRVVKRERLKPYQGRSFMSIPIVMQTREGIEKVLGVVNVTDRRDDRPFTPSEVEFVAHMARQAGLALTGAAVWQKIANLAAKE